VELKNPFPCSKESALAPILKQMIPVYSLPSYFCSVRFNIILLSSELFLLLGIPTILICCVHVQFIAIWILQYSGTWPHVGYSLPTFGAACCLCLQASLRKILILLAS